MRPVRTHDLTFQPKRKPPTLKMPDPRVFQLDADDTFSFINELPVHKKLFDEQLLLHVSEYHSQNLVLQSLSLGKTFRPVCTIVRRNEASRAIEERCHFAQPLNVPPTSRYIVAFQATNQRTAEFATLIWLVVSTYGLVSRRYVGVHWMSTFVLDTLLGKPSVEFISAMNRGVEGLHAFVAVSRPGTPRLRKAYLRIGIRKYKQFPSEEEMETFLNSIDSSYLIGAADKHNFAASPYFNDLLREYIELPKNKRDAAWIYKYVYLQRMWAVDGSEKASTQLQDVLQPDSRRAWPVQGFVSDPDVVVEAEMPSVIAKKKNFRSRSNVNPNKRALGVAARPR